MIPELAFFSRRFFGEFAKKYAPRLSGLQEKLMRSGIQLPVDAYLSFMLLISSIMFLAVGLNSFVIIFAIIKSLGLAGIMGLVFGFVGAMISFFVLYAYPSLGAGKKRRMIDESLPFALSFMSILASAGVSPKRMFRTLALLEQGKQIGLGGEASTIYRDIELLGGDLLTTLKEVSARKISTFFSTVTEGIVSTLRSGGELTAYLQEETRSLMRLRRSLMKEFVETLVMVSEMYMAIMVAFPLIMIVMLVVMSSIGGGSIGQTSPETIVPIIIYGLVPAAGLIILMLLDSLTPR